MLTDRCRSRIAHEDGAVRRCLLLPADHAPGVLHEAGGETWDDDDDRVLIHDSEPMSIPFGGADIADPKVQILDAHAFTLRVLALFAMFPNDCTEQLMWRCDGEYAPLTFMVNCSDVFAWACADAEIIEPGDIDDLKRAFADVRAADDCSMDEAPNLWVARKRRTRPQGAAYPKTPALWPLFDAAGPERAVALDNPKRHPAEQAGGAK